MSKLPRCVFSIAIVGQHARRQQPVESPDDSLCRRQDSIRIFEPKYKGGIKTSRAPTRSAMGCSLHDPRLEQEKGR